jgi:hypothetical protein
MPPLPSRRNAAYLNRRDLPFGPLDCDQNAEALHPGPDLRFISMARSSSASHQVTLELPTWQAADLECAAGSKGGNQAALHS